MFRLPIQIGGIDSNDENVIKASVLHEKLTSNPALLHQLTTQQKNLIRDIYNSKRSKNKPDFDTAISPVIADGATFCILHIAVSKGRFTEAMEERGFAAMPVNPGDIFNVKDKILQANCHIPVGGVVYITSDIEGKNKYNGFVAGPHISRIQRQKADKIEKMLSKLTGKQFTTRQHNDVDDTLVVYCDSSFNNFSLEIQNNEILVYVVYRKKINSEDKLGVLTSKQCAKYSLFDENIQEICQQIIKLGKSFGV